MAWELLVKFRKLRYNKIQLEHGKGRLMEKLLVCPCPSTKCKRHGDCAACREKHQRSLPYCERPPMPERKIGEKTDEGGS